METRFQTSFIPKRPLPAVGIGNVRPSGVRRGFSIYMTIAVLAFLVSLGSVGGAYGGNGGSVTSTSASSHAPPSRQSPRYSVTSSSW